MMILDLVNEFHFQNDKVAKRDDKFFQSQDLIHDNWMIVCRQCGQVVNYDFATIIVQVIEKQKESVYRRKYRVNKVLNNTIDKYHIMLSNGEINEFYRLF